MWPGHGIDGAGGEDDEGVEEHGFFEHGFARIERMIVCDGVAKLLGKQIFHKSRINVERPVLIGRPYGVFRGES